LIPRKLKLCIKPPPLSFREYKKPSFNQQWVVFFYSNWCGYSQDFAETYFNPIVNDLSSRTKSKAALQNNNIKFGSVDCANEKNPRINQMCRYVLFGKQTSRLMIPRVKILSKELDQFIDSNPKMKKQTDYRWLLKNQSKYITFKDFIYGLSKKSPYQKNQNYRKNEITRARYIEQQRIRQQQIENERIAAEEQRR